LDVRPHPPPLRHADRGQVAPGRIVYIYEYGYK
jgi:hypothetical protein